MATRTSTGLLISVALVIASQSVSAAPLIGECDAPATRVHTVQGRGISSPLLTPEFRSEIGQEDIVVEAVVVGLFPGFPEGLGGFFVQEEDDDVDDDPRTSEGLFVFDTANRSELRLGDRVRVRGRVSEFFGLTELSQISDVVVCSKRGKASSTLIRLPVEDEAHWERWEGMRVSLDQPLVVTGHRNLDRFGEIELAADARLEQATQRREPGDPALEFQELNARRRILLDDGSDAFRPEPISYLDRNDGGTLRLGDSLARVEGVLDFGFGGFRIQPTEPVRIDIGGTRPSQPPDVGGTLRFVTWNAELERQRAKLVETLVRLDPDIVALVEIENDGTGPESALGQLVQALNDRTSSAPYAAVHPEAPRPGRHPIAVGIIYRSDTVTPIGPAAILDSRAHPDFDEDRNRPSLAQTFQTHATGESLTVVANHFKSKGSNCDAVGDPDRGDGQGECNGTRTRAAAALVGWLKEDPTSADDAPVLVAGDLNAYPMEDPVRTLETGGYVDLIARLGGPNAHTFVFDGEAGRLDYAFWSANLLAFVSGADVWNTNADEPSVLDYQLDHPPERYLADPFRASDHNPVLVGLFPDSDTDGLTDPRDRCPDSMLSPTVMLGGCDSGVPDRLDEFGCTLTDDLLSFLEPSTRRGEQIRRARDWLEQRIEEGTLDRQHRGVILACLARSGSRPLPRFHSELARAVSSSRRTGNHRRFRDADRFRGRGEGTSGWRSGTGPIVDRFRSHVRADPRRLRR